MYIVNGTFRTIKKNEEEKKKIKKNEEEEKKTRRTRRERRRSRRTRRGGARKFKGDINIQTRLNMPLEKFLSIRVRTLEKELAACNDEKKQMHDAIHGYGGYKDVIKGYKKKGKSDKKSLGYWRKFDFPTGDDQAQQPYYKRREAEVQRGLPEGISPGSSVEVAKIGYNPYKGKVRGAGPGDNYLIEHDHTGLRETVPSRFVTKI